MIKPTDIHETFPCVTSIGSRLGTVYQCKPRARVGTLALRLRRAWSEHGCKYASYLALSFHEFLTIRVELPAGDIS